MNDPGDKGDLDELREAISSYGLQCRHASFGELRGDARSTAELLEFVRAGSYLGIQCVTLLGPGRFETADDGRQVPKNEKAVEAEREAFVAGMREALPEAETEGVVLTLAPQPGLALIGEDLREMNEALGSSNFAICYDPVQAHFHGGGDPVEDVATVAGITQVLLATDHAGMPGRLRMVPPGNGEMNLHRCEFQLQSLPRYRRLTPTHLRRRPSRASTAGASLFRFQFPSLIAAKKTSRRPG